MVKLKIYIIILISTSLFLCSNASATNLRGQVLRYNSYTGSNFPLAGVRVNLIAWNGTQWLNLAYSITGPDGMYYFNNVQPGMVFQIMLFERFMLNQPMTVGQINYPYYQDIPYILS